MNFDKVRLMFGVWLGVYPAVCGLTYLLAPLGMPLWLQIFCSTLVTVPIISLLVVPLSREAIAKMDDKPKSEVRS